MDLVVVFQNSLSPAAEPRRHAEQLLKTASLQPGFGLAVLQLLGAGTASPEVAQAAAVSFKNHVKYHWSPLENEHGDVRPSIQEGEKDQIKALIINLMLSSPPRIRAQLSEALTIISSHDFPAKWQGLLPALVTKLQTTDQAVIIGVLETANSIFKRFRQAMALNASLSKELEQCQEAISGPLLHVMKAAVEALAGGAAGEGAVQLLQVARLACRVFFSLNYFGLTDLYETLLKDWMDKFHVCLTLEVPGLPQHEDRESPLDALRAAVCANINLYMEKEEEDFAPYLKTFVGDVWSLLTKVSSTPSRDNVAMQALRFLTTVCRSVHYGLFGDDKILQQICESIVIPNLRMRDEDEELFSMNWIEYLRADAEGSDADTRRRAAGDLVRSLTERFPQQVTALCSGYVGAMLTEYAGNPQTRWKAKDCALYLVLALAVRGKTQLQGATAVNELVNIPEFFTQHVAPELQRPPSDEASIIQADALKFFTTFRAQISKEATLPLLPAVVSLLRSDSNVVHSYAAILIDRLLAMRDPSSQGGRTRFQSQDLASLLQALLDNIFFALTLPESEENEYVVRCLVRMISFLGPHMAPVAPTCLAKLAELLLRACQNPKSPGFNHYLFEAVAGLVRHCFAALPDQAAFEQPLFRAFEVVLQQDVQEFAPYVFQLLAQLLEMRREPIPTVYLQLLPAMLSPVLWERTGNVPALVRLLQAYLRRLPGDIVAGGQLMPMLGVFQKLISSKAQDHEGFYLLGSMVEHLPKPAFEPHLTTIWGLLFTRLQNSRTQKYLRAFLGFFSSFVCKWGPGYVAGSINQLQPGLFGQLFGGVVAANLDTVHGEEEEKLVAAACSSVFAEVPAVYDDAALFGRAVTAVVQLLSRDAEDVPGAAGDEEAGVEDVQGYSAAYARLANAQREHRDPCPQVSDARVFVAQQLAAVAAKKPGIAGPTIAQLTEPQRQALASWVQKAGVHIA